MSEEDLNKTIKQLEEKLDSVKESYETDAEAKYYDYVDKHESKLQERIDKAIEYVKCNYLTDSPIQFKIDLIKILEGSDKE